jgi:PAS domain S-box-containing protein
MTRGEPSETQVAEHLRSMLDAASTGTFAYSVADHSVTVDRWTGAAFGLDPDRSPLPAGDLLEAIHPDDRVMVEEALRTAVRDLGDYSVEHRVCPPQGERWLDVRGRATRGADGAVRILGTVRDSTDLRSARDEIARILEHVGEAFLSLDLDGRIAYANTRAEQLLQHRRDALLGRVLWTEFPELLGTRLNEAAATATFPSEQVVLEDFSPALGRWLEIRVHPGPNGISVSLADVTGRRTRQGRTRRLQQVAAALARALTPDDVAAVALDNATSGVTADSAGVLLVDEERRELRLVQGLDELSGELRTRWSRLPLAANTPLNVALSTRRPQLVTSSEVVAAFPHLARDIHEAGAGFYALLPLMTSGSPLGLLALAWVDRGSLDDDELAFLVAIAAQCAQALERASLYEQQRRIAESLQRSLLPQQLPEIDQVDFGARYLAGAAGLEVGGDWYDVLPLADGRVAFALGDVVGKGLPAAAAMGQVRYALRAYATLDPAPAWVLSSLDNFFAIRDDEELVTLLYGVLDPRRGVLVWSNAGHPPPLLIGRGEPRAVSASADGTPLGVPSVRQEATMQLAPGDCLLLFRDGVVESRTRPVGEGVDALLKIVADRDATSGFGPEAGSADDLVGRVLTGMLGTRDAEDDATLLAVRWVGRRDDGPAGTSGQPGTGGSEASHEARAKLRPEALASSSARRFLRSLLERWQLVDLGDVAELCVSELVTNAVLHARTPIELHVRAGGGVLHVEVCDSGGAGIDLSQPADPGAEWESGRGLFIVQSLSARTGVMGAGSGTCVWFELDLPDGADSAGDREQSAGLW